MKTILCICIVCVTAAWGAEHLKTTQPVNYLREGPASYYDVVAMIEGAVQVDVLERRGSWIHVRTDANETGWLSENSFARRPGQKNDTLLKGRTTSRASRAELAAAVKGFAKKYVPEGTTEDAQLNKYESRSFEQDDMSRFENSFSVQPFRGYLAVEKPFDLPVQEDAIGLGIAQRIAASGLTTNHVATAYVNMIANYLAKYTRAYDVTFRVSILADQRVNALSCPGGYIFITEGLLKRCSNEAELAAVIAHEMGHVIQRHGLHELHLRQPKIRSEAAFEELAEDVGDDEATQDEKDLDAYADEAYDNVVQPRLLEYEFEADQLAMMYLKRAGYDQTAELSILTRLQDPLESTPDIFAPNYMKKDDVKQRIAKVKQKIQSERWSANQNKQFADRFKQYAGM